MCVAHFLLTVNIMIILLCFDARTTLSLFTVNDPCQLPSVNFDMFNTVLNRHADVRIRPIVRRIRNL